MDARTAGKIKMPFFATYCHKASKGLELQESCVELAALLSYESEELSGSSFGDLIHTSEKERFLSALESATMHGQEIEMFLPLVKKDGSIVSLFNRGRVVEDDDGIKCVCGVLVSGEKTEERICNQDKELEVYRRKLCETENMVSSLQVRAERDALTTLFNASTTRSLVKEYLNNPENNCTVMIIDFDDFKHINDKYGHMVGDNVMTAAAAAIKKLFRANDIVGRIGGDEFLVLMKDATDPKLVENRCKRIVGAFGEIVCEAIPDERISCSVGAAICEKGGLDYDSLFCCADKAMYTAKNNGGNGYFLKICG